MVSSLGTTTLAIVYSVIVLTISFSVQILFKYSQRRKQKVTFKKVLGEGLGKSVLVTISVYVIAGLLLFSWHIVSFIYKDHEALKSQINTLGQEKDSYEKQIEKKDKEIQGLEAKLKIPRPTPTVLSPQPQPTPNLASVRIAGQKMILSANKQFPYDFNLLYNRM